MKTRWDTRGNELRLDQWATNGPNLVALSLVALRLVTEQEEQELAASVHAFAVRSRQTLTGSRTLPGAICEGENDG